MGYNIVIIITTILLLLLQQQYCYGQHSSTKTKLIPVEQRKQVIVFSVAIEKVKLMHECFPKHLHIGKARINEDKET